MSDENLGGANSAESTPSSFNPTSNDQFIPPGWGFESRWRRIAGFVPGYEPHPHKRREQVRQLWKAALSLIRYSLKLHEDELADESVDAEIKEERSLFWSPVWAVCYDLQISHVKLSGFCRELTGSNLIQTIDNVRAEGMKRKMRPGIREFVAGIKSKVEGGKAALTPRRDTCVGPLPEGEGAHGAINVTEKDATKRLDKWAVWKALQESRRKPEFCHNSWAQRLGFANYRRMYRACQIKWRMTPHQLEWS